MKMDKENYEALESSIKLWLISNSDVENDYKKAGFTPMRYRWDVIRMVMPNWWIIVQYNNGLNDDHIDTALRKIFNHKKDAGWQN